MNHTRALVNLDKAFEECEQDGCTKGICRQGALNLVNEQAREVARLRKALDNAQSAHRLSVEELGSVISDLRTRLAEVERLNTCDACGGSGLPISGLLCMCRGTGRMDEAARYLRERLFEVERERDRVQEYRRREHEHLSMDCLSQGCKRLEYDQKAHECDEELQARATALAAELAEWKTAILDATICNWTYTKEHETNPRKAVNDALAWESQVALDPAVSEPARQLHEKIAILAAALEEYGQHKDGCHMKFPDGECSCGYQAALDQAKRPARGGK